MSTAATCPFSDSADDRALARHTTNADWCCRYDRY
jgi:hypothetical protein